MKREIVRTESFVAEAAQFILQQAHVALGERDEFRIALSGGRTPQPIYAELARIGRELPWERVRVTFSDERCVPPEHAESNYGMARASLLQPAAVPERSVRRLRGEIEPHLAAQEYEDELAAAATQRGELVYRHDLLLLGVGDDGHTGSLFPGTAALEETTRKVAANFVPKLDAWRLTFTLPLIAQARRVLFTVGAGKSRDLLDAILAGDEKYPAARAQAAANAVTWFIEEPAD